MLQPVHGERKEERSLAHVGEPRLKDITGRRPDTGQENGSHYPRKSYTAIRELPF